MEPRPRGRGNKGWRFMGYGDFKPLQWSPDLAAGETSPASRSTTPASTSFNGAPTSRPGKLFDKVSQALAGVHLQWSPDLAAGETPRATKPSAEVPQPSMKPRPRGRGNSSRLVDARRHPSTFNGAPTSRPGKPCPLEVDHASRAGPSMEPRPRGRGNSPTSCRLDRA